MKQLWHEAKRQADDLVRELSQDIPKNVGERLEALMAALSTAKAASAVDDVDAKDLRPTLLALSQQLKTITAMADARARVAHGALSLFQAAEARPGSVLDL